jgi:hypothetical protein
MISLIACNLLSTALAITLKTQLRREIGRQFFICVISPFFGISFIPALLKDWLSVPFSKQKDE